MRRLITVLSMSAFAVGTAGVGYVEARHEDRPLAIVMTNDGTENAIKVYDVDGATLLQTLGTRGKGGVGGNAGGVKQYEGDLVAAVNYGSNTVAIFRRIGQRLRFDELVTTSSAPVSIDFGNDHMYVAGTTTVDSFVMHHNTVEWMDGSTGLTIAGGGVPSDGSTAQVGVLDQRRLLVTLKTDPSPGTVDVVALDHGAVTGTSPAAISAPAGSLTPFGFSVYPDGTAFITLAHSSQNGLFRDGGFTEIVGSAQAAPCWTVLVGKYVFTANTASRSISRWTGTGSHLFVDDQAAATIPTGSPTDLDAAAGALAVIDHGGGRSHLSLFAYNPFGELTAHGAAIDLGVANANGVAVMGSSTSDKD